MTFVKQIASSESPTSSSKAFEMYRAKLKRHLENYLERAISLGNQPLIRLLKAELQQLSSMDIILKDANAKVTAGETLADTLLGNDW